METLSSIRFLNTQRQVFYKFLSCQYSQSEALLTLVEEPQSEQAVMLTYDPARPISPVTEAGESSDDCKERHTSGIIISDGMIPGIS